MKIKLNHTQKMAFWCPLGIPLKLSDNQPHLSSIWAGSRDGVVVRAFCSYHCGLGSIPGSGVTCGLSLLLVLILAPRVFLRVLQFSSLRKNQHSKFQLGLGACMPSKQVLELFGITTWINKLPITNKLPMEFLPTPSI